MSAGTSHLAIDGGERSVRDPRMEALPRLGNALFGAEESIAAARVVESQMLWRYQGGDHVATLERLVAARTGTGFEAIAVNSGTSALFLAFAALRDRLEVPTVGIPMVGFVATATAALAAGLEVEFLDTDASLGIDPAALDATLAHRPLGLVLAVHPYGLPCDIEAILAVCAHGDVPVVEDVAQCFGGTVAGRELGCFGVASALSFQAYKMLSTGEGGMVLTSDAELAATCRVLHDAAAPWTLPGDFERQRRLALAPLNLRMSELEAAIGVEQLAKIDSTLAVLRGRHETLRTAAAEAGMTPCKMNPGSGAMSSLLFYEESRPQAEWTVSALRAEGVNATLFLPEGAGNRHWAGTWSELLDKCGSTGPTPAQLEASRVRFAALVHVPVMLSTDDEHIEQTAHAIEKIGRYRRSAGR